MRLGGSSFKVRGWETRFSEILHVMRCDGDEPLEQDLGIPVHPLKNAYTVYRLRRLHDLFAAKSSNKLGLRVDLNMSSPESSHGVGEEVMQDLVPVSRR